MNNIVLRGYLRDIQFSHFQGDIEYEKANLICPRGGGKEEDIISLRYKKLVNKHHDGDFIELKGNLRSYSTQVDGKNNVQVYVFTYFDVPEEIPLDNVSIDGRVCKINTVSVDGVVKTHFILANNIFTNNGKKINSYIPCIAFGSLAEELSLLQVNDFIQVYGEIHSHCYTKTDNDVKEFKVAHEVQVKKVTKIDG